MFNQYNAQRHTVNPFGHRIGTVPVGEIVYIDDRPASHRQYGPKPNNPWIVEAWHNREYHPCVTGRPSSTYMIGGHLATVRSLRDGRRVQVADWLILNSIES